MNDQLTIEEHRTLQKTILRIHEQGWGIAFGLVLGLGLFVTTNVLVIKGGPVVGPHLGLLGVYFPGYRVTFLGSLIGFVYAFVVGYGIGRVIATIYNSMTSGKR
jgi:hypothetical protein